MKSIRKFAICLLTAMLALLVLTACDGTASVEQITWGASRTKQYYEGHGVTGNNIFMKATISSAGLQGEYIFTRDDKCAYVYEKTGSTSLIWLTDEDGYVYAKSEGYDTWTTHEPNSIYGDYAQLIRVGYVFIVPNEQNVEAISTGKISLKGKEYTTETLHLNVNGSPAICIYYYGSNGLEFVDYNNGRFKMENLSGVPNAELLKAPKK